MDPFIARCRKCKTDSRFPANTLTTTGDPLADECAVLFDCPSCGTANRLPIEAWQQYALLVMGAHPAEGSAL